MATPSNLLRHTVGARRRAFWPAWLFGAFLVVASLSIMTFVTFAALTLLYSFYWHSTEPVAAGAAIGVSAL